MKTRNFTIYVLGFSLFLTGCGENFLETEPTEFISDDRIDEIAEIDPDRRTANLTGIYANMFATGTGGSDPLAHDDFGQRGYDIYGDILSSDMVLGAQIYGWYSRVSDMQTTIDYTSINNYYIWRYYFRIINGANAVIDGLGGTEVVPKDTEERFIMGQAKALRAYAYFYLANYFGEEYEPSEPVLPLYTDTDSPNQPLSTTEEVYGQIVSDLETAIDYLDGFDRGAELFRINVPVAQGLLAYTYSAMGENEKAANLAKDVIDNGGFELLPLEEVTTDGFNNIQTSSWMWGVDLILDMGLDLVSWWGQVDLFTYSYAWAGDGKIINDELYELIPEDDSRKDWFVDVYEDGQKYPINKFFAPGRTIGGQRTIETDYVYMRIEDMYLLHAENAAKINDEDAAKKSLKALLAQRLPDPSYVDDLSGEALLDEIILQTRIELWGEGKSYLSMKRNELTITLGSNHVTFPGAVIPYNDDRLTFEIPQSEIQNNPEISF